MIFFNQYFNPKNNSYSIIIEDDGRVAYAYLLEKESIIGDVWLYNRATTPEETDWQNKADLPFLNPREYIRFSSKIEHLSEFSDVKIQWFDLGDNVEISAKIFINEKMIAILKGGHKPGWSSMVKKDGPLAKMIKCSNT